MLATANSLLAAIGADQNAITSLPQLRASASSLFVALFELFFAERLTHVRRADLSDEALAFNAQQVVDALRRRGDDLPRYVSGRAIAAGDLSALQFMLVYFAATLARAEALAADDADAEEAAGRAPRQRQEYDPEFDGEYEPELEYDYEGAPRAARATHPLAVEEEADFDDGREPDRDYGHDYGADSRQDYGAESGGDSDGSGRDRDRDGYTAPRADQRQTDETAGFGPARVFDEDGPDGHVASRRAVRGPGRRSAASQLTVAH
ncbi:hypothetical protein FNF28_07538 [Cafeteria roenbergensis]|uniref:DUF5745 domain-containing protein n=1 Tax=Cafeteria roenbergensis TaxID=33653 RepID=A0A5A8C498_CAFRO|nr:hypothetical protein FNF28_07538 [Cafeteria roenbergensis]